MWLDASDVGSVSVDNQRVTEWRDKSGNEHHMKPLAGSVIYKGGQSGKFIQFGGGSLTYEGGQNVLKDDQKEHSLFIVLESETDSGSWTNPIAFQRNASTDGYRLERTDKQAWKIFGSQMPSTDIKTLPIKDPHIIEVMSDKKGFLRFPLSY